MMNIERPDEERCNCKASEGKRIVLWGQEDLLMTAVKNLLGTGRGWRVVRMPEDWDDETLTREVERLDPDVLIMNEDTFSKKAGLLMLFALVYSKLKIITIGLQDNRMEIYNKQTICIHQAADLVSAIERETGSER